MNTIFIVTEANATVATGHLMECIVCAEELMKNGYEVLFWINDDMEEGLKRRIPCRFLEYHVSIESDYEKLLEKVYETHPNTLLFNLREISEGFLKICRKKILKRTTIVCIDEFGHRNLSADIIVNPMIDPYYWDYGESKAKLFCGSEYLILPKELEMLHGREKRINDCIHRIIVTMGGVDPKNYTLDLVEIVSESFYDSAIDIIIGGGNSARNAIVDKSSQYPNITVAENVSNLSDLIYEADLIICAGGNTLHESACIGTPAIVLPSMPHEERTAECFVKKGFGMTVNVHFDWKREIPVLLEKIRFSKVRSDMSKSGKSLSDGLGRKRMVDIIENGEDRNR